MKFNETNISLKRKQAIDEEISSKKQKKSKKETAEIEIKNGEFIKLKIIKTEGHKLIYNEVDANNNTALHQKIINKTSIDAISKFSRNRSNLLEAKNIEGKKPLDLAIDLIATDENNYGMRLTFKLLKNGAELNSKNFRCLANLVESGHLTREKFFNFVAQVEEKDCIDIFTTNFLVTLSMEDDMFKSELLIEALNKKNAEILSAGITDDNDLHPCFEEFGEAEKGNEEFQTTEVASETSRFEDETFFSLNMEEERKNLAELEYGVETPILTDLEIKSSFSETSNDSIDDIQEKNSSDSEKSLYSSEEEKVAEITVSPQAPKNNVQTPVVDSDFSDITRPNFGTRSNSWPSINVPFKKGSQKII